ncbi:MAG: J domain-containing protein [Hyphomonadaceae bacterium]|nr:J domain-containing protein [Hyphomonadaceae bacterium]
MASAFQYRPKFVDIRVKPPADENEPPRAPEDRPCDKIGCDRPGGHKAPKARDRTNEFWHFCREHAADYNSRWNYFAGMSDAEVAAFQDAEHTGHRPTWTFKPSGSDRTAAEFRAFQKGRRADAFGLFRGRADPGPRAPRAPRLSRLQTLALEALHLEEGADPSQIRARYAELVKRYHPDVNGGDRACEAQLQRVIRAYQTLKAAGLA